MAQYMPKLRRTERLILKAISSTYNQYNTGRSAFAIFSLTLWQNRLFRTWASVKVAIAVSHALRCIAGPWSGVFDSTAPFFCQGFNHPDDVIL
jgi:hypothetical protein